MAGLGKKTFTAGDVLIAGDVNNYLMDQTVMNFATTAARSSAIPVPSTGMVSYVGTTGTASIPQLETYTGSAWQTPYGFTLLANVSVTGATSTTISNVFTSAYTHYKILVTGASANATALVYTNTLSGTKATTGYSYAIIYTNDTTAPTRLSSNANPYVQICAMGNYGFNGEILISNPAIADTTRLISLSNRWQSTSSFELLQTGGLHLTATAYDGFNLESVSGSWSGTIRVFGLRNS
jgi:hypothetical protein